MKKPANDMICRQLISNFSGGRGTIQILIFIAFTGLKTTLKIY